MKVKNAQAAVPPAEVTRVKGLGFLFDKRTQDRFNGRVIKMCIRDRPKRRAGGGVVFPVMRG